MNRISTIVAALALAGAASFAHAQTAPTAPCPQGSPSSATCGDINNNLIYGRDNSITDLNTTPGYGLGSNTIVGNQNSLSASYSRNQIFGDDNVASGALGSLSISGNDNTVQSDDHNITITGSGNKVTGTQGLNLGLQIDGGSNSVNASSGSVVGNINVLDNVLRGSVTGYYNTMSNAADSTITGNGDTLTGNQSAIVGSGSLNTGNQAVVVGSGSTNTADAGVVIGSGSNNNQTAGVVVGSGSQNAAQNGTVIGSGAALGADATNSVALGNGTQTDRADTVDVGGRTVSSVSDGVLPTDAVNLRQLDAGLAQTLNEANNYTDQRFSLLNTKINQASAAAAALGLMSGSAASIPTNNKVAASATTFNGQSAVAMGYQHIFRTATAHPVSLTLGAAFSGGQRTAGAAVAFGF